MAAHLPRAVSWNRLVMQIPGGYDQLVEDILLSVGC
jgi:hypothetical protein